MAALFAFPIPLCIDCEFPNPWGHVKSEGESPVAIWLLLAPFLAGALAVRKGWLVPPLVVLVFLISQPLGGVAWWSLRENEGPFILMFGLPITMACFVLGFLLRAAAEFIGAGAEHTRYRPLLYSSLIGGLATAVLLFCANAGIISAYMFNAVFAPELALASALQFGTHDLKTLAVVFLLRSAIFGAVAYHFAARLWLKDRAVSDKRS
jgi:hypothetical protein